MPNDLIFEMGDYLECKQCGKVAYQAVVSAYKMDWRNSNFVKSINKRIAQPTRFTTFGCPFCEHSGFFWFNPVKVLEIETDTLE